MSEKPKQREIYEHDVSIKEARSDIESNFPDIEIVSIESAGAGFTNIAFLVNGECIFRFAKRTRASKQIETESMLLPQLESTLNLPIPHVERTGKRSANGFALMGYKKIVGEPLQKETFDALDEPDKEKIASDIATFIRAIHAFPVEQAEKAGVTLKDYKQHYTKEFEVVKERVYPLLETEVRQQLEKIFQEYLSDENNFTYTPRLLHSEISSKHVLVDDSGKKITGIIDFGDVHIGDPDFDFFYPYKDYGPEFTERLLKHSPEIDESRLMKKMKFFSLYHHIIQIIFIGIRESEDTLKEGMRRLHEFFENDSTF